MVTSTVGAATLAWSMWIKKKIDCRFNLGRVVYFFATKEKYWSPGGEILSSRPPYHNDDGVDQSAASDFCSDE